MCLHVLHESGSSYASATACVVGTGALKVWKQMEHNCSLEEEDGLLQPVNDHVCCSS